MFAINSNQIVSSLFLFLQSKPVKQVMGGSDRHKDSSSIKKDKQHQQHNQQQQQDQNNSQQVTENHVSPTNPTETNQERTSPTSTTTSNTQESQVIKKKQRNDFRFGKILGEGSYSEVSAMS